MMPSDLESRYPLNTTKKRLIVEHEDDEYSIRMFDLVPVVRHYYFSNNGGNTVIPFIYLFFD